MTPEEHIKAARNALTDLEREIQETVDRVQVVKGKHGAAVVDLESAEIAYSERIIEINRDIDEGESKLEKAKQATIEQESILTEVTDKNATLKIENTRLEEANKEFKEYEGKANKSLNARDESLIARTKAIEAQEILLANRGSFIPKKDD